MRRGQSSIVSRQLSVLSRLRTKIDLQQRTALHRHVPLRADPLLFRSNRLIVLVVVVVLVVVLGFSL
jgi:hypothetical protein